MFSSSLDERRCHAPDGRRPHPPRMSETEGEGLKGRDCEIVLRHEGLAPVRLRRLETGIGLGKAGVSHAERRIDWPVVFREVPSRAHDPGIPWTPSSLFTLIGSAAAESDKRRPSVRDHEKAPALHSLAYRRRRQKRRRRDRRTAWRTHDADSAATLQARIGSKIKKRRGGQRKSLKKLDSAKEGETFYLDFVPPDLEFVPFGLDFVPKNLDIVPEDLDFLHCANPSAFCSVAFHMKSRAAALCAAMS